VRALVLDAKQQKLRRYVRILQLLAETEDQLNKNRIRNKLEGKTFGSEPTILYAIDDLRKWRLIRLIKTNTPVPGGGTLNYYVPTRSGVENLISAGVLLTETVRKDTVKLVLQKYSDLLQYADQISELWPIFVESEIEDIAVRRLAMFLAHYHGEHLYNRVYNPSGQPIISDHALFNARREGLHKKSDPLSLNCTADDDVEAFLNPNQQFFNLDAPFRYEEDQENRWIATIRGNGKLQAIVARAAVKDAISQLQSSNDALEELSDKPIRLNGRDVGIYRKLTTEIDKLRSKIVTSSS
jgi:hypothetical protein